METKAPESDTDRDSSLIVRQTMICEWEFLHTSAVRTQSAAHGKHRKGSCVKRNRTW